MDIPVYGGNGMAVDINTFLSYDLTVVQVYGGNGLAGGHT